MPTWNLGAGDPLNLHLAADARLTPTNIADDQIWELSIGGGEPAAVALQTTYGLRAHWMRIFPRFVRGEAARTDPAGFHAQPRITSLFPNSLSLVFAPFEGLEVLAEYRVAESNIVTGRIKVANQSILPQNFRLELVSLLNPIDRQGGMVAVQTGPTAVMEGETSFLNLALFMTGGPQASQGPYPALCHEIELYPGNWRQFTWAAAATRAQETALDAARSTAGRPWEAEQARVELLSQSQTVRIRTGDPDWDTAFALSQVAAQELLVKNAPGLPNTSFVLSRRPDHGFSLRGDASDYSMLWGGQTALDTYYLTSLLLPGAPELAAGLLRNFIDTQDPAGIIDWRPGLGGQRSRKLAQPLLASLAVQIAPYLHPPDWYAEVFPPLLSFFEAWFAERVDKDEDGFPEWETSMQSGVEDSPIFDRWSPAAQGMQIDRLESPALAAMLLGECRSLVQMAAALLESQKAGAAYARLAGASEPVSTNLQEALERLCEREKDLLLHLESTWNPHKKLYQYRDYQTHASLPGELVLEFGGPGKVSSRKRFPKPRRLVIHLKVTEERSYPVVLTLHGYTAEGEASETLGPRSFAWNGTQARATTQNTYLALKRVEVIGLSEEDQTKIYTADLTQEDCSLFLPLWAGAPGDEAARQAVEENLLARYMGPFGIPLCPEDALPQAPLPGLHTSLSSALLPWNQLIGEGLLRYGYRAEAAGLVTRLMDAIVPALKNHRVFRQFYDAHTGLAAGERGHLHGLAPVGLFLKTLGIQHLSSREILLDGFNPFPWVVNVQYRRVKITCYHDRTEILLKDDQRVTIDRTGPHRISLT